MKFDKQVNTLAKGLTDTVELSLIVFGNGIITDLCLTVELKEKIHEYEQKKIQKEEEERRKAEERRIQIMLEAEARREFQRLKDKYQVSDYWDSSPVSPLNRLLIEIEEDKSLLPSDEEWLNLQGLFPVLAIYYEHQAVFYGIVKLAVAGKYWRKANEPQRSQDITENVRSLNNKEMSIILTMRGGAFKDIEELDEAEKCGQEAIRLTPNSYYPYKLLGAIKYQSGLPEIGDKYFKRAHELGSPTRDEDEMIKKAMERAGKVEQKRVAEYLLQKDCFSPMALDHETVSRLAAACPLAVIRCRIPVQANHWIIAGVAV